MKTSLAAKNQVGLLEFERDQFRENFPTRGFKTSHHLCGRPEFLLPRLVELAQRLPESQVEYYAGNVPINQDRQHYRKNGLSVVDTVRRIEESGSWMVLKNVEVDPEYGKLLRAVLDDVYQQFDSSRSSYSLHGLHRETAFIFISSPNSVTPYHLDDEHNFLCQIRGHKNVSLWDPKDRTVMPESQIENMLEVWHDKGYDRHMPYREEFQERATVYELKAGEALHFPFGAPHWVKNGPAVSISFSVTFRSQMSERQSIVYFMNRRLRRLGLDPMPPERSEWRDSLKYGAFQAARQASRLLRGRNQSE
jgi:Cupin-like domain